MNLLNDAVFKVFVIPKTFGEDMRALSLTRPWPWAFVNGAHSKRIENRRWKPPARIIGKAIALHAAKSWNEEDRAFIADVTGLAVPPRGAHQHGIIFALCRVGGFLDERGAEKLLPEAQEDWFFGPYGWQIDDFMPLVTPVICAGALGLWDLPAKVEQEVRTQVLGNTPEPLAARLLR